MPFANCENDYDLALNIAEGTRPKIVSGTPSQYNKLMRRCWDADPKKRPRIKSFKKKIINISKLCQNENERQKPNPDNIVNSRKFNSKTYNFKDLHLPEPKNKGKVLFIICQ